MSISLLSYFSLFEGTEGTEGTNRDIPRQLALCHLLWRFSAGAWMCHSIELSAMRKKRAMLHCACCTAHRACCTARPSYAGSAGGGGSPLFGDPSAGSERALCCNRHATRVPSFAKGTQTRLAYRLSRRDPNVACLLQTAGGHMPIRLKNLLLAIDRSRQYTATSWRKTMSYRGTVLILAGVLSLALWAIGIMLCL